MRRIKPSKTVVLSSAVLYCYLPNAVAQLEEVVVTARRVEESLQDVPVSISAVTAEDIAKLGILDTENVAQYVPNITMENRAGRTNNSDIFIRGVGGGDPNAASIQAGVGIYIDGMYMPRIEGGFLSTLDTQRIEVLRGPQGTLFGKNTIGGAVNIVSTKPQDEFAGSLTLRAGDYNRREARGMINVPLSDKLFSRFTGLAELRDGFYTNTLDGEDYGNRRRFAGRAALRFVPTGELTFDVSATYVNQPERPQGGNCIWTGPSTAFFQTAYEQATGENFQQLCNGDIDNLGGRTFESDLRGNTNSEIYGLITETSWAPAATGFFDDREIKLIAGIREQRQTLLQDRDMSAARMEYSARDEISSTQRSVELQFNAGNDRLSLVSGFYWADDIMKEGGNNCQDELASIDLGAGESIDCINPGLFQFHIIPDLPLVRAGTQIYAGIETYALYGNLNFSLTDALTLTVGARQTWEERDFIRLQVGSAFFDIDQTIVPLNANNLAFNNTGKEDWSELTPTVSLSYALPSGNAFDSGNVYFTYANGFQSGGFNTEFTPAALGDAFYYQPETVDSYEIGLKSTWLDGRMRLNLAMFKAEYDDRQVQVRVENTGQFALVDPDLMLITNAAAMDTNGIELELSIAPVDRMLINFSFGTLDTEFTEFFSFDPNTQTVVNELDRRPDNLNPDKSGSGFIEYAFDLPSGGTLTPRLIASYKGDLERDPENRLGTPSSLIYQDAYTIWDARLSWSNTEGSRTVTGFVTNLTDEDYLTGGSEVLGGNRGWTLAYLGPPRMWGIQLQMDF